MNKCSLLTVFLVVSAALHAQAPLPLDPALGITTIPLYEGKESDTQTSSPTDAPTLTVFGPQAGRGTGSAVIIMPGGAYIGLASNLEGRQVADWFTARGFTAFVLKYRVGPRNLFPIPLLDAQRAIRLVRSYSKRYALVSSRIGIIGFSAGGHLAASVATLSDQGDSNVSDPVDRLSSRPDFVILGYPWLNAMEPAVGKEITYCSMIPSVVPAQCAAFAQQYTPRLHVTAQTPPTFLYATSDDAVVPVRASVDFYNAMIKAGAPVEMHLFRHGDHGSGLGLGDGALDLWTVLLEQWLRDQGLLTQDPSIAAEARAAMSAPARKPGEHLTLDSRIADVTADPGAMSAVNTICGSGFLESLPKEAQLFGLKTIAPYFPAQLNEKKLAAISKAFEHLPIP